MWYKKPQPEHEKLATVFCVDTKANIIYEYTNISKEEAEEFIDRQYNFNLNFKKG